MDVAGIHSKLFTIKTLKTQLITGQKTYILIKDTIRFTDSRKF